MPLPDIDTYVTEKELSEYISKRYGEFQSYLSNYDISKMTHYQIEALLKLKVRKDAEEDREPIPKAYKWFLDRAIEEIARDPQISLDELLDRCVPKRIVRY